ncbi:DcrB-related protein [Salmonella enterica subsp. enterica]
MYEMNEGTLDVPAGWRDDSVNVFVCPDNSGINLTVTRTPVGSGMAAEDVYEDTAKEFPAGLPGYQETARRATEVDGLPAFLLEYHWKSPEGPMHQMVVLLLKEADLLSFTVTSPQPMSKKQTEALLPVITSFRSR